MKPIVILDTESTGTSTVADRVVQLAVMKLDAQAEAPVEKCILINPERPIPAAATEIHGITDDMVKGCGTFKQYSTAMYEFLDGCDYAGFNILGFDIPIVQEEFLRVGIKWPAKGAKFYDAMKVFHEKEKRDLAGAMKFYCGQEHDEAHDAMGDVQATWKVIKAQMAKYPDVSTYATYAQFCETPGALDLAARLVLNAEGVAVYNFGKHKGKPVKSEPGFAQWMMKNDFPTNTLNILKSIIYSK